MTTKEEALERACLIATTGSIAYGLNHANSDVDQMGIFIADTLDVAGLDWNTHKESWTNTSPEGDDLTLHEVGKYLRLCLGGNPTLIELLFMDNYSTLNYWGKRIVDIRDSIISESTLRKSYLGYARSQFARIRETEDYKKKMARHTLRIARQGTELLLTGGIHVRVGNPDEYFELTEMPKDDMLEVIWKEIRLLEVCDAVIPEYPDREKAADLLRAIRADHMVL